MANEVSLVCLVKADKNSMLPVIGEDITGAGFEGEGV